MKSGLKVLVAVLFMFSVSIQQSFSQDNNQWSLRNCIDYALQNNIEVKKMQVGVQVSEAGYLLAKANLFPSLNASVGQSYSHKSSFQGAADSQTSSFTGDYSLRSDVTIYNGFKLKNTITREEVGMESSKLGVKETENNIELAVTAAYLQVLYAREEVINAENTLQSSEAQMNSAKILYDAGYIAESNYSQVQAQNSSDSYALVIAKNNLSQQVLSLKQLLELDINRELQLSFPEVTEESVIRVIPDKGVVYNTALNFMPEIKSGQLAINSSELDIEIAKAGLLPSLALNASTSTGYDNAVNNGYATQLADNFYQNVGLTLSIPLYNKKQVKTSVSNARLNNQVAQLNYSQTQKDLLSRVETAYLDASSAQSRFIAAKEQLRYTKKSYALVEDQFNLGMKNTVDLLTEKTKFLEAQQEYLQAKYSAVLNYKLLDFYQQKRIEL
jgi:outer membrane protein